MGRYVDGKHKGHLDWSDRLQIEKMLRQGYSKPQIARYLGVHHSTIYEECRRGAVELVDSELRTYTTYSPEVARDYHARAVKNMEKGLKIGKDHALARWLVETISSGVSPAAACSMLGKTPETTFSCTLCRQTVYKYIENGELWPLTNKRLRFKGSRKNRKKKVAVDPAARAPQGTSIERRPKEVGKRERYGDWEMDSVESCEAGSGCLLVMTERKSRQEIIIKMPAQTSANVVAALDGLERSYGSETFRRVFRSITVDNGSEFADCIGMETSALHPRTRRTKLYYCHPRCPGERGSNEKQNQMIRWHFPKGTDFSKVSEEEVRYVQDWLNGYPRRLLGWRCSADLFNGFLESIA